MDADKQRLIDALKVEREYFDAIGNSTKEHDAAIEYLETGETDKDPEEFDLLYAAMYDYKCLLYDYNIIDRADL